MWRRAGLEWRKHFLISLLNSFGFYDCRPFNTSRRANTCQSIKEFTAFPIRRVVTGAGPIRRAIYDRTILGLGLSVKSEAVNGQRGGVPLFGRKSFQCCTLRCFKDEVPHRAAVCTHRGLCLSSARIWSLGFSPNLSGENKRGKVFQEAWRPCEASLKQRSSFGLTCQGSLCPQQLRCPAGGSPSQRACFHCAGTKADCFTRTPTHQVCTTITHSSLIWWIQSVSLWFAGYCFGSWQWITTSVQHLLPESVTTSKVTTFQFGKTTVCNYTSKWNILPDF